MRRFVIVFLQILLLAVAVSAGAATGRVAKVLPFYLDAQGRHTLSPSLFDRDAYQARLRRQPALRSALRFDVLWRVRGATPDTALKLRVELRGIAQGDLPREKTLEQPLKPATSRWTSVVLSPAEYKEFGEVTAWRVTLWAGDQLLGEQKSFLW